MSTHVPVKRKLRGSSLSERRAAYRLDEYVQAVASGWFAASPPLPPSGQVQEYASDPRHEPPEVVAREIVTMAMHLVRMTDDALEEERLHAKGKKRRKPPVDLQDGKWFPPNCITSDTPGTGRKPSEWQAPVDPRCDACGGSGVGPLGHPSCSTCGGSGLRSPGS